MTRYRASLLHLTACLAVAIVLICLLWLVWYPPPLMEAIGGTKIFLMLLAIDVVLGPLLTLVVFRAEKKSLRFDLSVIVAIQLLALAYGVSVLFWGRPVYVAALGHRFDVIQASEIEDEELLRAGKSLPLFGPVLVGTQVANDDAERERVRLAADGMIDRGHFPQHHQPIENMREEILKNAQPISALKKLNPGEEKAIDGWLAKRGVKAEDAIYQGLKASQKDMAVVMDARTATVIGFAPFKPW